MCDPADNPASENASVLSDHAIAVQHFKDPSRYRADYGAPFSILFVACMLVPSVVILLLGAFALAIGPYGLLVLLMRGLADK